MHRYRPSTAGERLTQHIHANLDDEKAWRYLENVVRPVGEPVKLAAYYRHHAALFLSCKIITVAKSICSTVEDVSENQISSIVERAPWNRLNAGNRLLRLLVNAVRNSHRPVNPTVSKELLAFAKQLHPHCYICGTMLNFDDEDSRSFYTAEHLWPSCYGGNSIEENLLPACIGCNNRKRNAATWVSTDVHALFLGLNPANDTLATINFLHRYAVFHRAAFSLAIAADLSLKEAFLRLGPWTEVRLHDTDLAADMFNLRTHEELEELEQYENL